LSIEDEMNIKHGLVFEFLKILDFIKIKSNNFSRTFIGLNFKKTGK